MASFVNLPLRRFLHRQPSRVISSRNVQTASTGSDSLYPPVLPSRTAKSVSAKRRVVSEFFSRLRACAPEEKIRALSRIQRKKFVVYPQTFALNADRWYQHFTKTAYVSGLPHKSVDLSQSVLSELRSAVLSSILQEHWHVKRGKASLNKEQQHTADPCLTSIVRSARNVLVRENGLLRVCSVDLDPRVHFYWLRGERTVPKGHRSGRVEPVRFQIDDRPHSQIRVPQQLPEFVPLEEDIPAEVPVIHSAPDLLPLFRRQYDNNIFIGSKLEDPCCYGHTQFHLVPDRFHRDKMSKRGLPDQVEVFLRANGIASLFAWTGAQAMYQGFWSEEDVSRPFVSQAVITDGQYFSFFCYQLNTLALTQRSEGSNPRKNLCWGTESMRLYERVTDGEVVGWNDEVLRLLAQFLLNKP